MISYFTLVAGSCAVVVLLAVAAPPTTGLAVLSRPRVLGLAGWALGSCISPAIERESTCLLRAST